MRVRWMLPCTALAGGFAAFFLRTVQNRTGFEPVSGLPIPGSPAALALLVLLALTALLLAVLAFRLDAHPAYPFEPGARALLFLPVAGSFLVAAAGAADLAEAFGIEVLLRRSQNEIPDYYITGDIITAEGVGINRQVQILFGVLLLMSALGLLVAALSSRRSEAGEKLLLIPPICLVVRLIAVYRVDSVNPVLEEYVMELLSLTFLTLGFYGLSAFPFRAGRFRTFAFYAGCAVAFSLCALADGGESLSTPLLALGGSLTLLGFLLMGLATPDDVSA